MSGRKRKPRVTGRGRFPTRELLVDWVLTLRHVGPYAKHGSPCSFAIIGKICGISAGTAENITEAAGDNWRDYLIGDIDE